MPEGWMATRCEAVSDRHGRCCCVVAQENRIAHAVYTEDGLGPYILCENHLKVLRRGHCLSTKDGKRWRGITLLTPLGDVPLGDVAGLALKRLED